MTFQINLQVWTTSVANSPKHLRRISTHYFLQHLNNTVFSLTLKIGLFVGGTVWQKNNQRKSTIRKLRTLLVNEPNTILGKMLEQKVQQRHVDGNWVHSRCEMTLEIREIQSKSQDNSVSLSISRWRQTNFFWLLEAAHIVGRQNSLCLLSPNKNKLEWEKTLS